MKEISELEKAASSLRDITFAIEESKVNLEKCRADVTAAWLAYNKELLLLSDTEVFLEAQEVKQANEVAFMRALLDEAS